MRISLNWLQEFVEVSAEPKKLKADLTSIGLNVESLAAAGDDWLLEVEVTTNRPDCLSHYGVAREVAALYRKPLKRLKFAVEESLAPAAEKIVIEIADPKLCRRYCGRVIEGVQVAASPGWVARRLEAVGQRPINNIADVTNYVLMELGHPLHAFNLARIRDRRIIVRSARAGEPLRTLDGVDRRLTANNLVIADAARPLALAGVMGGEDSEISLSTKAVLLESAWFDPASIRRTSKSQGLHTEASHRFERGADLEMVPLALDRAAALIAELAGGKILRGRLDIYPAPESGEAILLRQAEILRILGTEIAAEEVERILGALGFTVNRVTGEGWRVTPPSFRPDVKREVDLIEEVARQFGYDRMPARVRPAPPRIGSDLDREKVLAATRVLTGLGYREIIPSSMVDPEENELFTDRTPVALANPLSQDASAMRSSALPSMVRALGFNLDRGRSGLCFFELGKTYQAMGAEHPKERRVLVLGLANPRRAASVHEESRELDFFDVKGDVERLLEIFDLPGLRFGPSSCQAYEPGASGQFLTDSATYAVFGQLRSEIQRRYKLRTVVWIAEIDFEQLAEAPLRQPAFRPYSKFPAVERDFSLVVPENLPYRRLEEAIEGLAIAELLNLEPLERKTAAELPAGVVPEGHVSLLLRVTFQSMERTLTREEVDDAVGRIVQALEPLRARLRT
jgi:phenylalanyl-tRNA synthetase beta chain